MNVKQFKRRWLNHYVEPELFYMPVKKQEEQSEEFIFEVSEVDSVNIDFFIGMGYTPNIPQEYDYSPLPKNTKITNHFSWNRNTHAINTFNYGVIERPVMKNGIEITKEKFPECFTNFPIHDIERGKCSENMILPKKPKVEIDWGDGTSDIYETPQFSIEGTIAVNEESIPCKLFRGYKNLYSRHTYKKVGTYIIKIKGFLPSLILPKGTTRIINWGNIGLRSIYNMCNRCQSTIKDFGNPKNLEKVVTSSAIFTSNNACKIENLSFLTNMPNLVNATQMFSYSNITYIPDNAFIASKYLCYLEYATKEDIDSLFGITSTPTETPDNGDDTSGTENENAGDEVIP